MVFIILYIKTVHVSGPGLDLAPDSLIFSEKSFFKDYRTAKNYKKSRQFCRSSIWSFLVIFVLVLDIFGAKSFFSVGKNSFFPLSKYWFKACLICVNSKLCQFETFYPENSTIFVRNIGRDKTKNRRPQGR